MEKLESYRRKMGMTQKTLAIALDANVKNIAATEKGKRQLTAKQKAILEELIKSIPDPSDNYTQNCDDLIVINPSLIKELPYLENKLEKEQLTYEKLTERLENEKKEWLLYFNASKKSTAYAVPEFDIKMRNARIRYRRLATRHQNLWIKIEVLKAKVQCTRHIVDQSQVPVLLP